MITGMTSAQCNPNAHRKSYNYTGLLWETLRSEEHHEVFWRDPRIADDEAELARYDRVIVGIAPISALGANRAYGALNIIEQLWGSEKLALVVDAPEPNKMQTAFNAIIDHPENLTKPFFAYRKDYAEATSSRHRGRLLEAVKHLAQDPWPTTIVPGLPWLTSSAINSRLPAAARGQARLLSFDHVIVDRHTLPEKDVTDLADFWVYEPGSNPSWNGFGQVGWEKTELPHTHRVETNIQTAQMLRKAGGCLISPTRYGTWWSPRYAMSVAAHTPVFTEWRESADLNWSWGELPTTFESYAPRPRLILAEAQHDSWMDTTPDREQSLTKLYEAIQVDEKKARKRKRSMA